MTVKRHFDVIIVGGSYSGLAAAMALGRALKKVLVIDSGKPCNMQTPHSHNFLTQDGKAPHEIAALAKHQVQKYDTVQFQYDFVSNAFRTENGFEIKTASGEHLKARKLIFATGILDIMPGIEGLAECWGISALHCPYCHGFEVRNEKTGILGNGEWGFEFSCLISNWTKDLTLFTNGKSMLTDEQVRKLENHHIMINETQIREFEHSEGYLTNIIFKDGNSTPIKAIYVQTSFKQHCIIPETLGCEMTAEGYIKTDHLQKTNLPGVFACGDNTTSMRTVANAVAMGTMAGMILNKEMVLEGF